MLPIAGQTAGPNGLKLFVDTHGGGVSKAKNRFFFSTFKFFYGNAGPFS